MRVLVTGAAGMIGRKLIERLLRDGAVGGQPIERIVAQDVVAPSFASPLVEAVTGDLSAPGAAEALLASRPGLAGRSRCRTPRPGGRCVRGHTASLSRVGGAGPQRSPVSSQLAAQRRSPASAS